VLAVIIIGCHYLEKSEFREGESDRLDNRERSATPAYIATVGGIFEETPRSWGMVLQIHSSKGVLTSYLLLHWVTDKRARSSSDGHLDSGAMT
jgi:hypothetical protein